MDMYHLTMYGSFTDAHIALKGYLNCNIRKLRLSNNTSIATPSAFRLLSYDGDMYGTTLAIEDIYVSGHLNVAAGGITSVVKADPASGRGVHFIHPIFESINGIAFDIAKGNQVIVEKPYIENCPNSNANIPVFELGVTGAAAPNNAYDTATYLGIYGVGEEVIQYSQGAATLTRFINADVALAIDLFDIRLTRCITLVTGTNSTQQLKLRNVVSASVTTVTSGMTGYKVFDLGGNVFQFATLPETNGSGVDGVRDTLPATLLRHTALYASSDVGTEGRMAWYDKVNARWNSFRVKQGTAPTSRTWVRGDAVDNAFPSAGGATAWSCTASGTAGSATWQVAGQAGAAKGNTAARPTKTTMGLAAGASDLLWSGTMYLDTTLAAAGKPIWWSGSAWVDATGTAV
jgi:hypothetical protein